MVDLAEEENPFGAGKASVLCPNLQLLTVPEWN